MGFDVFGVTNFPPANYTLNCSPNTGVRRLGRFAPPTVEAAIPRGRGQILKLALDSGLKALGCRGCGKKRARVPAPHRQSYTDLPREHPPCGLSFYGLADSRLAFEVSFRMRNSSTRLAAAVAPMPMAAFSKVNAAPLRFCAG